MEGENILYGYISIGVMIIISLIVFVFVICKEEKFNNIRYFLIAIGVGALAGDAIIHILPDVLQKYDEDESGKIIEKDINIVLLSMVIIFGYLVSFFIEKFLHIHPHDHEETSHEEHHNHYDSINKTHKRKTHLYKHGYTFGELLKQGFIVNLLLGDIIHNFVDGLMIMASYHNSFEAGLATSIAIALHEIPHEVSNFAAFRKTASFKQAVLLNFFGAISSLLGGTAILLIQGVSNISDYILCFGAGNFIYVSTAILVPELEYHNYPDVSPKVQQFFQITGILSGVLVMYLILFYEQITGIE